MQAHLYCRNGLNLTCLGLPIYESGNWWGVPEEDAQQLVAANAMLYLHDSKADRSYIGGRLLDYRTFIDHDDDDTVKIVFKFEALREGRGVRWSGRSDDRARYSGIVV